jgi:hypothetical protein
VSNDVRLILEKGFERIAEEHDIETRPWPPKEDIDVLVHRTGRLIIFAATVLKFVDNDRFSAKNQLAHVMTQTSVAGAGHEYELVDELYLGVLGMAARRTRHSIEADPLLCTRLRMIVGAVVLLQNPMSIPALAQLIGIDETDVT